MAKLKTSALPKELIIYVFDHDESGNPMYAVANNVNEISEDCDGTIVGNYYLNNTATFRLRRELK